MRHKGWLIVVAVIFGSQSTEAQQQKTLTLACKGTTTQAPDEKPKPVSMGIVVNFAAGTVQGFSSLILFPLKITASDDAAVAFEGSGEKFVEEHFSGTIDRVTGDVQAAWTSDDPRTHEHISTVTYALQCRPTQRMF